MLEVEIRYNHLKSQSEIDELRIAKQKHIIILILSVTFILSILLSYHIYRKKAILKIHKQQGQLDRIRLSLLELSIELEKKKNLLETSELKNGNATKLQEEIADLSYGYRELQKNLLSGSAAYGKLSQLAKQNIPRNNKSLITDELWKAIIAQIGLAYPDFKGLVYDLYFDISENEWQYCCLYMFGFDNCDEAKLLNINPASVRTKHLCLDKG